MRKFIALVYQSLPLIRRNNMIQIGFASDQSTLDCSIERIVNDLDDEIDASAYRDQPGCAEGCTPCSVECAVTTAVRDAAWHQMLRLMRDRPAVGYGCAQEVGVRAARDRWATYLQAAELCRHEKTSGRPPAKAL